MQPVAFVSSDLYRKKVRLFIAYFITCLFFVSRVVTPKYLASICMHVRIFLRTGNKIRLYLPLARERLLKFATIVFLNRAILVVHHLFMALFQLFF